MKIGDHVSVIDEDLEGKITSVKQDTVYFKDDHGFVHEYQKEKLVLKNASIYEELGTVNKKVQTKSTSQKNPKIHKVLDLHFEKLVENPDQYNSTERLFIQRDHLIETIEFCRKNKIRKLEIIHGIGDGVLQKMVHDYLEGQTNLEFEDHEFFYHQTGKVTVFIK